MVWFEGVAYERFPLKRCYRKVPSHMALQNSPFQKRLFETETTGWSFSKERLLKSALWIGLFLKIDFLKSALWMSLFLKIDYLKSALWIGLFLKIDFSK